MISKTLYIFYSNDVESRMNLDSYQSELLRCSITMVSICLIEVFFFIKKTTTKISNLQIIRCDKWFGKNRALQKKKISLQNSNFFSQTQETWRTVLSDINVESKTVSKKVIQIKEGNYYSVMLK